MTESEIVKEDNQIKPGTLLKQKRESLGLTQKQIADKLRLRLTVVQSLEENNFDIDKVSTFTRGYVRSYAKLVGIEDQVILTAYDHYCGAAQELSMTSFSRKTTREQHNSRINLITVGIVAIVIGISSVWWYQNQEQDTLAPSQRVQEEIAPETQDDGVKDDFTTLSELTQPSQDTPEAENAVESESESPDTTAESVSAPQKEQESEPTVADAPEEPAGLSSDIASETAADNGENSAVDLTAVTMSFEDDCWVRVSDASGKTLLVGLKKANQSVHLQGEAPFKVILGAPESVSMTFAGEPVDLSGYTSGKVARFSLP